MLTAALVTACVLLLGWAWWNGPLAGMRRRSFARLYDWIQRGYERHMTERRAGVVSALRGEVLEIGPGTGVNFEFLDASVRWSGLEPNPWMRERLRERASGRGREVEFLDLIEGRVDACDSSFDTVLSTLVLCSVGDVTAVLSEVRRVLRPGGSFVFLEHTAAPAGTGLRRWQRFMRPVWKFIGDGCHPDRDLERAIRDAGFSEVRVESFRVPKPPAPSFVSPHITGTALKA